MLRQPIATEPLLPIGTGGFKGAPDECGCVELGYGIVPEQQRRGYATEAVRAWVDFAFAAPQVRIVVAQTLPHRTASIRVLEKTGFRFAGAGNDSFAPPGEPVIRYELARDDFGRNLVTVTAI